MLKFKFAKMVAQAATLQLSLLTLTAIATQKISDAEVSCGSDCRAGDQAAPLTVSFEPSEEITPGQTVKVKVSEETALKDGE